MFLFNQVCSNIGGQASGVDKTKPVSSAASLDEGSVHSLQAIAAAVQLREDRFKSIHLHSSEILSDYFARV